MMGAGSWIHWLIVLLVIMLLFGAGRISGVMGDLGRGIKSFKKGLNEEDEKSRPEPAAPPQRITDERTVDHRAGAAQPTSDYDKS